MLPKKFRRARNKDSALLTPSRFDAYLKGDPDEVHNLIDDPSLSGVRDELVAAMATWFVETGDQVPWRWDLRSPQEPHPEWSEAAAKHGFVRDAGPETG